MENLQLHFLEEGEPRILELQPPGPLTAGRTEGNDLIFNHPSVSRRHGQFELRAGSWWVVDLNSTNGIKVNGTAISEAGIKADDKINFGSLDLEVRARPAVDFSDDTPFEDMSGTVIRRISDFNSEFGLDVPVTGEAPAAVDPSTPQGFTREKILGVLVQVARALMQSEDLNEILETVMEIIFKHLAVERGLLILFDAEGEPIPRLTKFREGAEREDIPISRTILKMVRDDQVSLLTSNALEDARLMGGKSIAIHGIRSAMCVPLWNRNRVIGAIQVDSAIHIGRFTQEDLDMMTALANFAAVAIERAQLSQKIEEEKKIRGKLERYHSPGVIDEIVRNAGSADPEEIRNADVTILFADLTGFTSVSETKAPAEVSEFLSHFFSAAVDAIFAHGGTLDKFIGDAVLAFFGAPLAQDDHALRAVRAGMMMQRLIDRWNEERKADGLSEVRIRVGINSGPAVVGNVGTEKRVDYTVLGSSVNIASRLESSVAKPGDVVISENTWSVVSDHFRVESLGEVPLKGISKKMPVYKVVAEIDSQGAEVDHRRTVST
ncbi:MAG: GAF domain-containing protein [Acidobacteria bacterium]|nr:GAF domain-containing protein [Acidobacteriota bacterium]